VKRKYLGKRSQHRRAPSSWTSAPTRRVTNTFPFRRRETNEQQRPSRQEEGKFPMLGSVTHQHYSTDAFSSARVCSSKDQVPPRGHRNPRSSSRALFFGPSLAWHDKEILLAQLQVRPEGRTCIQREGRTRAKTLS
jgi:hypothetical protein